MSAREVETLSNYYKEVVDNIIYSSNGDFMVNYKREYKVGTVSPGPEWTKLEKKA